MENSLWYQKEHLSLVPIISESWTWLLGFLVLSFLIYKILIAHTSLCFYEGK
jgi:hypothetical protein